ncbi:hypothetical protein [Thalassotalea castellviae]|uniref:Flagellar biosynthesis protein FlgE n=1 Tax=Thalassotalea castellviae TaxID=3075612 RepID=A0ABU3A1Q6_9GAMM|nr:hypothetical protein [Thalassotalea sp. W431]MDT0604107.1 hypothetical protein [Thalassotalea sp. W431]
MNVQSAFNSGVEGFQKATESATQAASDIAHISHEHAAQFNVEDSAETEVKTSSVDTPNLNQSIVDLKVAEHQAKASANVIKTADEALGTLLDVSI